MSSTTTALDFAPPLTVEQFIARYASAPGAASVNAVVTLPGDALPGEAPADRARIAVVVRSPSDRWLARFAQMVAHLKAGVSVVLLLDVTTATVSVYRPDQPPCVLRFDDTFTLPDVLPGFAVPVGRLFA